jgi:hypothetical protein
MTSIFKQFFYIEKIFHTYPVRILFILTQLCQFDINQTFRL